jgi:uncharacterized RDD family membrane protein YckC
MNWHYTIGGQSYGPITEGELDSMVQAGTIGSDTLVWRDGMANWEPYNTVKTAPTPAPAGGLRVAASVPQSPYEAGAAADAQAACSECGTVLPRANLVQIGSSLVCAQCKPRFVQKLREGVDLNRGGAMTYAGFWIRFGAAFVDGIILNVVNFVVGFAFGMATGRGEEGKVIIGVISMAIGLAYDVGCVGTWGATPGKMACGLRIVTAEGEKVSYARALGRYLSKLVSVLTCLIGFIIAGFDDQKRALHDRICSTRVVRK